MAGRGIIMLLSGPPGVGKALTAESSKLAISFRLDTPKFSLILESITNTYFHQVAETMRVPLYTIGAGDLGVDPRSVESTLSQILELVTKWKAILLLDEADVFLEQRSVHELEENKLVSGQYIILGAHSICG
jgi:SpoVK/Ycf46/Vps4 family AAA+-type ATPase